MKKLLLFLLFSLNLGYTYAYTVSGYVTNDKGEPLEYVNILVKGTNWGVNTNEAGYYSINLSSGQYQLVFKYIGYNEYTKAINVNDNLSVNVTLTEQTLDLKSVQISNDEDPAYPIIRAAIAKREFYLKQVQSFSCDTYMKGRYGISPNQIVFGDTLSDTTDLSFPEMGMDSSGIFYLSESESTLHYQQPDDFKEEIHSSLVSGMIADFTINNAKSFYFNIYDDNQTLWGLSKRPFISPIGGNSAFIYYRFKLEGFFVENGHIINKIKVIPKRKSDPVFSGYIYIVEKSWAVHSYDFVVPDETPIDFVDSLKIRNMHSFENDSVWMLANSSVTFNFYFIGIKFDGLYLGIFNNYNINKNFDKGFFRKDFIVFDDSAKKSFKYFEENRKVELSEEEKKNYQYNVEVKDWINSKEYKDSTDSVVNRVNYSNLLTIGYTHRNSHKGITWNISGAFMAYRYNTVEGNVVSPRYTHIKKDSNESYRTYFIEPRYGFSNNRYNGRAGYKTDLNKKQEESIAFEGGSYVFQFNEAGGIPEVLSTYITRNGESNYSKVYEKRYVNTVYDRSLARGLGGTFKAEFADRIPMINTIEGENYTSNDPFDETNTGNPFMRNNALTASVGITYQPGRKYIVYPNKRIELESNRPTFFAEYAKGFNGVLNSKVNFDKVNLGIQGNIKVGLLGKSIYMVDGGRFINNASVFPMDFFHFTANQTGFLNKLPIPGSTGTIAGFNLLGYYQYSTSQNYVQAHFEHSFGGFLLNKIPLIRKLKWHVVSGVHVLATEQADQHYEFSVGLENIGIPKIFPGIFRLDYFVSFEGDQRARTGFMFGTSLTIPGL